MRSNYKKIGPYIRQVDIRNIEDKKKNLLGVSTQKVFIDSIANTVGTDFRTYKVVKRRQFTYVADTSRRGDRIGIALLETHDEGLVSPIYTVFEIIDHDTLLPEYLMMWFRRPEFDRYARFKSHGSVRELFDWEEMCDVELPMPSIEKQREIVKEYQTIVDRMNLNEQLTLKLKETAQAIYKQWFVDFEFPISAKYAAAIGKPELEDQPYKSSGGEMVYNEVLKQEIPKGWTPGKLSDIYAFQYGKGNNNPDNGGKYPVYGSNGLIGWYDEFNSEDAPVIGHIGINCGSVVYAYGKHFVTYNGVICNNRGKFGNYLGYVTLLNKDLKSQTRGSSQPFVSYDMLEEVNVTIPDESLIYRSEKLFSHLFCKVINIKKQNTSLLSVQEILMPKLSKSI
jgi:type I restriction enzyme, S subunit